MIPVRQISKAFRCVCHTRHCIALYFRGAPGPAPRRRRPGTNARPRTQGRGALSMRARGGRGALGMRRARGGRGARSRGARSRGARSSAARSSAARSSAASGVAARRGARTRSPWGATGSGAPRPHPRPTRLWPRAPSRAGAPRSRRLPRHLAMDRRRRKEGEEGEESEEGEERKGEG